jgi:hypothetical protein
VPLLSWLRSLVGLSPTASAGSPAPVHPPRLGVAHPEPSRAAPEFPEGWGPLSGVGESQYQPALRRVAQSGRICWATLVPEPDNPFDGNAVCVKVQGETVAYLSRTDARRYQRRLLQLSAPMQVPAKLIGGTADKPTFGILVDCREVERLPKPTPVRRKKVATDPTDQPF